MTEPIQVNDQVIIRAQRPDLFPDEARPGDVGRVTAIRRTGRRWTYKVRIIRTGDYWFFAADDLEVSRS